MVNLPSFEISMKVSETVVVRLSDGRNSGFIEEVVGSELELVERSRQARGGMARCLRQDDGRSGNGCGL
jgi:hypothetical protein